MTELRLRYLSRIHRLKLARSTIENGLDTPRPRFLSSSPLSLLRWPRHARNQQRHDKLARVGAFATRSCVRATNNGILRQYVRQRCKKNETKHEFSADITYPFTHTSRNSLCNEHACAATDSPPSTPKQPCFCALSNECEEFRVDMKPTQSKTHQTLRCASNMQLLHIIGVCVARHSIVATTMRPNILPLDNDAHLPLTLCCPRHIKSHARDAPSTMTTLTTNHIAPISEKRTRIDMMWSLPKRSRCFLKVLFNVFLSLYRELRPLPLHIRTVHVAKLQHHYIDRAKNRNQTKDNGNARFDFIFMWGCLAIENTIEGPRKR